MSAIVWSPIRKFYCSCKAMVKLFNMVDLGCIVYAWSCLINMAQVVHSLKIYILFAVTETPGNSKYAEFSDLLLFVYNLQDLDLKI